jgi:hypothetical protein
VGDSVLAYVHDGCNTGSLRLLGSLSSSFFVLVWTVFCELVLRRDFGREVLGLSAFFRPNVHHVSRSPDLELLELVFVMIEPAVPELSRAFRSRRCPTFSVSGSVHDRSAENMSIRGQRLEHRLRERVQLLDFELLREERARDQAYIRGYEQTSELENSGQTTIKGRGR